MTLHSKRESLDITKATHRPPYKRPLKRRLRIAGNTWVLLFIGALLVLASWMLSPSGSIGLGRIAITSHTAITLSPEEGQTLTLAQVQDKLTALGYSQSARLVNISSQGSFLVCTPQSGQTNQEKQDELDTLTNGLNEIGVVEDSVSINIAITLAPKAGETLTLEQVQNQVTAVANSTSPKTVHALSDGGFLIYVRESDQTRQETLDEHDELRNALAEIGEVKEEFDFISAEEDMGMRLGLDLKGGSNLVYQAEFQEEWSEDERQFYLDEAITTIRNRIDKYGVTEPVIQQLGSDRMLIQLPGITDIDEAKALIEQTGFLEFREVEINATTAETVTLNDYLTNQGRTDFFNPAVTGKRIFGQTIVDSQTKEQTIVSVPYLLTKDDQGLKWIDRKGNPVDINAVTLTQNEKDAYCWMPAEGEIDNETKVLTGAYLTKALPQVPPADQITTGREISVGIEWNSDGAKLFDEIAARLNANYGGEGTFDIQACLGIFLDDELLSYPQVTQKEYKGSGQITGNFTYDEARLLAIQLSSGALEMPLKKPPLFESQVSATLGADFVNKAVLAGIIGLSIVMLFMMLYYRFPGVLASLALLVYAVLVLAIFKWIPVTLTLAGIAGFVMSLGMAVDANVLIFERLKEELRAGRTLKAAIEAGFHRAWSAIWDSNATTLIACGVLYWFGSSVVASPQVKGFALTLAIGVLVSMFSAITVTRTFLRFFTGPRIAKRLAWFGVESKDV